MILAPRDKFLEYMEFDKHPEMLEVEYAIWKNKEVYLTAMTPLGTMAVSKVEVNRDHFDPHLEINKIESFAVKGGTD